MYITVITTLHIQTYFLRRRHDQIHRSSLVVHRLPLFHRVPYHSTMSTTIHGLHNCIHKVASQLTPVQGG